MARKLILLVLLGIIVALAFFAYRFNLEKKDLFLKNRDLTRENTSLSETAKQLQYQVSEAVSARQEVEGKVSSIENQLTRMQDERDTWKKRYENASKERDILADKLRSNPVSKVVEKVVEVPVATQVAAQKEPSSGTDPAYWADFVKAKAELEAKLENLESDILESDASITDMEKRNKELSIKIDEITKQKEDAERELSFRQRTIDIVTRDLVNERDMRTKMSLDFDRMRKDNLGLKRELVLANKEKAKLQNRIKDAIEKKTTLERRVGGIESILKEKSMALQDLQDQLHQAISGSGAVMTQESASVELPPIVVRPEASGPKGTLGEIIAVNQEEKFVVVDVGEVAGIKPGYQFRVVRGEKDIATIEVIETRRDISAADVREIASGYTIQEGDKVFGK